MIDILSSVPDVSHWTFIGLTVVSFLTSTFGIVAGLGGGVLLIAVMATIFPPAVLIPLHGMVQLGSNISRGIIMRREVAWALFPAFAIGSIVGATIGGKLVISLPTGILQIVLGLFLLYVCWAPRPKVARAHSRPKFFLLGGAGALISMFVGATGTILAPFVAAACRNRGEYVATHGVLMIMIHGLKVIVFGTLGFAFGTYLPLMAAMIAATFLGNLFGRSVLKKIPERLFQRIFQVVLTILALRLLFTGLSTQALLS